ncbi:MAG: hypothetical protein IKB98_01775 [Clostridia bacterium]|nr:hypothetical protein [Clostridia bacterium]
MKVYLIINDFRNEEESSLDITAYATRELAEANIKPMIESEINTQIENGLLERSNDGKVIDFANGNGELEISDTELYIDDGWGLLDHIYISEKEILGE